MAERCLWAEGDAGRWSVGPDTVDERPDGDFDPWEVVVVGTCHVLFPIEVQAAREHAKMHPHGRLHSLGGWLHLEENNVTVVHSIHHPEDLGQTRS